MIEIHDETEIDGRPEAVFTALSDLQAIPSWQSGVIEVTAPPTSSVGLGTEFAETWKMLGRKRVAQARVAMYRPDEVIAFSGDAGFMDFYCAYSVEPTRDGKTRVSSRSDFRFHGLWRLVEPFIRGEVRREVVAESAALKRRIETNASGAGR